MVFIVGMLDFFALYIDFIDLSRSCKPKLISGVLILYRVILIIIILSFSLPLPALADPFSDVPHDHWSFEAVQSLEEKGLLEGYPDGVFLGDRPVTRYEMAMIVARVMVKVEQLQASVPQQPDFSLYATEADMEIINKLLKEYKNELTGTGVTVNNMEDTLLKLMVRVKEIERVKISGKFDVIGVGMGITPCEGNISGPGTVDDKTGSVKKHYDRFLSPTGGGFPLEDGFSLISRLDLTVSANISDNIKTGGNLIAYSEFGTPEISEGWGLMPPYNPSGSSAIWNQHFQTGLGTAWVNLDGENLNVTMKFGEYSLTKSLFTTQRCVIGRSGLDYIPLEGIDITGKLYNKIDFELFTAENLNTFRRVNDHSIYTLGTPYNNGEGTTRLLTGGIKAPGLYDNYMYGFSVGYGYEKIFHIEGAFIRLFDDFASNPGAPSLTYFQEPRGATYYGFKGDYNINETVKIYGELNGTNFDINLRDPDNVTGRGYLFDIGCQVNMENTRIYCEFDYTQPDYDPFSYHKTWKRLYVDGHHNGWTWKFGSDWANPTRV